MSIEIKEITRDKGFSSFLELPDRVYRGDNCYCKPSPESVTADVFRADFEGRQSILLASENGNPTSRAVLRISPVLKDKDGLPTGMIGFFESMDNRLAVQKLFSTSWEWFRDKGIKTVIGPMNGDTWHKYRINVGPYDTPPFLMEPYNRPYYANLWTSNRFELLEEYYSLRLDKVQLALDFTDKFSKRILDHGYRLRRIDMSRFKDELAIIHRISTAIFADNFLFTPIDLPEFLNLYKGSESLIDPDFLWFAMAPDGKEAGFVFSFPDRLRAVSAMRGNSGLTAKLKYLLLKNSTDTINIKSLGVLPEYQRTGLALALMNISYKMTIQKGYKRCNLCLIKIGNSSGRMDGGFGYVLRQYQLYQSIK